MYGSTDEFGFAAAAVDKKAHVHDLHATILHGRFRDGDKGDSGLIDCHRWQQARRLTWDAVVNRRPRH